MSWVLLSFTVIFPMSTSLGMAFSRREDALKHLSIVRSTFLQLYSAHASWDWPLKGGKSGRKASSIDWLEHSDNALEEIVGICDDICRYLTLPTNSRARHRMTAFGSKEASELTNVGNNLFGEVVQRIGRMALFTEILKREGMPANEGMSCGYRARCAGPN